MKKEFIRQVVAFEDYFKEFRNTLDKEALKKLYQILTLIMMVEVIPVKFLRAIEGRKGLYEIRVEQGNNNIVYSAVSMKGISSFYSMDFRKRRRRLLLNSWIRPKH